MGHSRPPETAEEGQGPFTTGFSEQEKISNSDTLQVLLQMESGVVSYNCCVFQMVFLTQIPQHLILFSQEEPDDGVYPLHNGVEISGVGINQRATALEKIRLLHKKASKLVA